MYVCVTCLNENYIYINLYQIMLYAFLVKDIVKKIYIYLYIYIYIYIVKNTDDIKIVIY